MTSICIESNKDMSLLNDLSANDFENIGYNEENINDPLRDVIKNVPKSQRTLLDKWKDKNPLQIVCFENRPNGLSCVTSLLTKKADSLHIVEGTEKTAVHYAAEGGNIKILTELLGKLSETDLHDRKLNNIFYTLIEYIQWNNRSNESQYEPIFTLLLEKGLDINIPEIISGETPIYAAAFHKLKEITTLILKNKQGQIDLESFKDGDGKCAKDLIQDNSLYDIDNIDSTYKYNNDKQMLYKYLREDQIEEFRQKISSMYDTLTDSNKLKLLELAVRKLQLDIVQLLLNKDENNIICLQEHDLKDHPMVLACQLGFHKIVALFGDKEPSRQLLNISILEVTKAPYADYISEDVDYDKVVKTLSSCTKFEINIRDSKSYTSLHHAVRYQNSNIALALLNNGASMACKDTNGKLPTEEMDSEILEKHLNNCISYFDKKCMLKKAIFLIKFTSLLPPREGTRDKSKEIEDIYPLESDVLQYMGNSSELKHLLTHPVILAFIYIKWHRIGGIFLTDLAINLFIVALLVTYIVFNVSYVLLVLALILLIIRELFQIIIFSYRYIYKFDNWLKLFLCVITIAMIFYESVDNVQRQLSAVAIIMCAIDFVLLLGYIPRMSTNITILRTICWTFLSLMFWYSILLSGFAYGFHILFDDTESNNNEKSNSFANMGFSLLKTVAMALGEFDTTALDFNLYPPSSYLVFLIFVFFIAIVLFNLMISLAISDTKKIKKNAEIYEQKLLVDYIAQIEALLQISYKYLSFIEVLFKRVCVFPLTSDSCTEVIIDPKEAIITNKYCNFNLGICTKIHLNKNVQDAILKKLKETNSN